MSHHPNSLYDALSKLRLLAAVLYDKGTASGLSEEEKEVSVQPIRVQRTAMIQRMIKEDLGEVIGAIKNYQEDAFCEEKKSKVYKEKAKEALTHMDFILDFLKQDMESKGETERIQGNYMAVITNGKLYVR